MGKLNVFDRKGNKVGTYTIEPTDLVPAINKQLLHDAVVMYQANLRQGSHKTKTRGEVSGSTRKLYRQKGTGNARAGTRRSGTRRGGGHIHALVPKDYSYRLPRKALQQATRMAIASKIQDEQLLVIDDLAFDKPKTADMAAILRHLDCDNGTLLVATDQYNANVYKSARNMPKVTVAPAGELNALTILTARRMLATKKALDLIKERAASDKKKEAKEAKEEKES